MKKPGSVSVATPLTIGTGPVNRLKADPARLYRSTTSPAGMPYADETVMVNVTGCPNSAGFGAALSVIAVAAFVTVRSADAVAAARRSVASPANDAWTPPGYVPGATGIVVWNVAIPP